jgi:2-hydroxy-3-keto-5-methylthiopentenyl-1-phosphate phosphatase
MLTRDLQQKFTVDLSEEMPRVIDSAGNEITDSKHARDLLVSAVENAAYKVGESRTMVDLKLNARWKIVGGLDSLSGSDLGVVLKEYRDAYETRRARRNKRAPVAV